MNTANIRYQLEGLGIEIEQIADERIREAIYLLYNLIEELSSANRKLQEENQKLRDENNKLKGEQGKPKINPQTKDNYKNTDFSSEDDRKNDKGSKNTKRKRNPKNDKIIINRT